MEAIEYEKMAEVEDRMWYYRALHQNLLWAVGRFGSRASLLDAGCGTGGFLSRAVRCKAAKEFHGLDVMPLAIDIAKGKLPAVDLTVGSVTDLPYTDGSFDVIVSADVVCQVEEADKALEEFNRVLKPGGVLVINMPAYQWLYSYHDEAVHNLRRYSGAELRKTLCSHGFDVRLMTYWNSFLFPVIVIQRRLLGSKNNPSDVRLFHPALEATFRMITSVERLFFKMGLRLPFGCAVMAVGTRKK